MAALSMVTVSAVRLALAGGLLLLARLGYPGGFALAVGAALAIDAAIRLVARRRTVVRGHLARWAEFATWAALPLGGAWLAPDVVHAHPLVATVLGGAVAVPLVFGFIKYGTLTHYGARSAAPALYLVAGAVVLAERGGPGWPLGLAALAAAVFAGEEIAITVLLPEPMAAVPSIRAALRLRRERRLSDPDPWDAR